MGEKWFGYYLATTEEKIFFESVRAFAGKKIRKPIFYHFQHREKIPDDPK